RYPEQHTDFYVLSLWGGVLGSIMWRCGPWPRNMIPFYWPVVAAGLLCWLACAHARLQQHGAAAPRGAGTLPPEARAA
ncbi:MAG: hypothetical protein L0Z62_28850, partial [Gemmataceae bacterium]|nr:hypothetical protein [Gemmataceae bacterium]